MIKYQTLKATELKGFAVREIRREVVEKLKERIKERGYNIAKPLTVVENNEGFFVADGNHRLVAILEQNINEVPCVIYSGEGDIYNLAVQANIDEDTYAPMDLFDWLEVVRKLKDEGKGLKEVGEHIGWEESKVKQYSALLNKVTNVLGLCKQHQSGRVTEEVTTGNFNFTERWFRDSGLYDICEEYKQRLINGFIADKFNWNKSKVQSESAKYKLWQEMALIAGNKLVNIADLPMVSALIENNTFKTIDQLQSKLNDLNKKASNKLICGDALIELESLDDGSVDLVITDPPYGMEYVSNKSKYKNHVTKEGITNDGYDEAVNLFNKTCEALFRKTKADAHLYFFINWENFHIFREIASKYFDIKTPIVWYKSDGGIGDLDGDWINGTEIIIFCTKGNRKINKRRVNILDINRLHSSKMIHPTQKPVELIKEILSVSAQHADTFLDPFMGSGAHIKAVKEYGNINYIGIELDPDRFEKAKAHIGGALA